MKYVKKRFTNNSGKILTVLFILIAVTFFGCDVGKKNCNRELDGCRFLALQASSPSADTAKQAEKELHMILACVNGFQNFDDCHRRSKQAWKISIK